MEKISKYKNTKSKKSILFRYILSSINVAWQTYQNTRMLKVQVVGPSQEYSAQANSGGEWKCPSFDSLIFFVNHVTLVVT